MAAQKRRKTQAEAAVVVGVDRSTVAKWEEEPDSGSDVKIHKASTPDCRTSIGKKETMQILAMFPPLPTACPFPVS